MGFWNRSIWWLAAFVVLGCLFTLAQTAQTSSGPVATGGGTGTEYFTVQEEGHAGTAYGVNENGHSVIYSRTPSDR